MSQLTLPQMKAINVACTTVSVASAVATPFLISKANRQAQRILEHYDFEHEPLKVRAKYTWKCYIPAGAVMALGMAASITNGVVSNKVTTALTAEIASHALTIASNNEVQEAIFKGIKEKYGLDVEQEMRNTASQSITDQRNGQYGYLPEHMSGTIKSGSAVQLCDDTHGRHFIGSVEDVKAAVNEINAAINAGQEMSLADIYEELGMETGTIDRSLYPMDGELFDLEWSSSIYEGQPCAHFGFKRLRADSHI